MERRRCMHEEIKNFIVNVAWTHKIQICQSDLYISKHNIIKYTKIILSSFASVGLGSFLTELLPEFQEVILISTFIFSLVLTIVIAIDNEVGYKDLAIQNKNTSDTYWELREKALELLYKVKTNKDLDNLDNIEKDILELKDRRLYANSTLPYASPKAVKLADKKIKKKEDNNYSNDYALFIPHNLIDLEDKV